MVPAVSRPKLVSAIIIFLNEERFLEEAIASVLTQTYPDWELLLVDDGSEDGSRALAQCYAARYPNKIRYYEHPGHQNRGMSASRNLGVDHARGAYIAFCDADDVWLPGKLEHQVEALQAFPEAAMVCGPLIGWHSWTGQPADLHRDYLYGVGSDGHHPFANRLAPPPQLLALFLRKEHFAPSGGLIRREAFEQVGGFEVGFRGGHEDLVFQVKLCLRAAVYVQDEAWYKYRIHPNSSERRDRRAGHHLAHRVTYLTWVADYLARQGATDPVLKEALHVALWPVRHPRLHPLLDQYRLGKFRLRMRLWSLARRHLPQTVRRILWRAWQRIM